MLPIRLITNGPQGTVLTDAAAIFVGAVIDERTVVNVKDTVLDPEICSRGSRIQLPFTCMDFMARPTDSLYYPAFDHQRRGRLIHLNRMAVTANMLLRTIQAFNEGSAAEQAVQKMVRNYQLSAIRQLGGKNGVVNSNLIASRVMRSARGVLLVNGDRNPEVVGVPSQVMRKLKLDNGDLIFVGREPTIWHGSIEVARAKTNNRYCIELHPLLFKQLGADCDGDTVYVYAVPKDAVCQEEAASQILGFTKQFATWPPYMRVTDEQAAVDWEKVQEEGRERCKVTGFSVTPREIMEKSDRVQKICRLMGKEVADECLEIATGIDEQKLRRYVKDQNDALLHMKVWMGPIGSMANKLRVFAGTEPMLLASASYVSERLQQMLLDTKHFIGRKEGYGPTDVMDILNRKGRFGAAGSAFLEDVVDEMAKMGMDREKIWPIMANLWLVHPMIKAFDHTYGPAITGSTAGHTRFRMNRMRQCILDFFQTRSMKTCLEHLERMMKTYKVPFDKVTLLENYGKFAMGLNDICKEDYPLLQLMTDQAMEDSEDAFNIAGHVIVNGVKDRGGVTRLAIEEALDVRS